jgi:hypothetical protein
MSSPNPDIRLLYLDGCPLIDETRSNLSSAISRTGEPHLWQELELRDPATPREYRNYPSPTVLVNGRSVDGRPPLPASMPACRRTESPTADEIYARLDSPGPIASLLKRLFR